ncbi:hypothetical protein AX15_002051 [Amanita polypyramis BW_CC]|nr:hypothetical protein AX15_002051 [Amanita polypyramis BW_CC]
MPHIRDYEIPTIVNLFVEALLYGVYITTLIHCLRWLVYNDGGRSGRGRVNVSMLIVSIVIFLFQTVEVATAFKGTLLVQSLDPTGYNIFQTVNIALEYTLYQIVDAVLIHRCWVVYGHAYKIIFLPVLLWISSVALTGYAIYLYASTVVFHLANDKALDKVERLVIKILNSFLACNITINIYATTAIVYRIVRVTKNGVARFERLRGTWRIIAESGVLYTTSTMLNLIAITLVGQNPTYERYVFFQAITDPINITMAGIAYNLILIRVGQQRQQETVDQGKSLDSQVIKDKEGQALSTLQFHNAGAVGSMSTQNPSILHLSMDHQYV